MGMIDVGDKPETLRIATAQALLIIDPQITNSIKDGNTPKGNIYEVARVAATLGAKKTSDLIPYCHPIPIDDIKVNVLLEQNQIKINVTVKSIWKTGVEMEALTGASIAALSIYDMLKPLDRYLKIDHIHVVEKHGGINDFSEKYDTKLNAAVLVITDSRDKNLDKSGKIIINALKKYDFNLVEYKIVPDNTTTIEDTLRYFTDKLSVDIIISTGGTGVGNRDNTPEATKKVIEKEMIGISENLRDYGQRRTPLSMLSRGVAGIRGKTVIINMPGSTVAVSQSLNALFPGIMHIFKIISGHSHDKSNHNHNHQH